MDLARVAFGLVLPVSAGDALVRGAVNLALRLGIPALVVGLTVVAFGTSAPELPVSVNATLADQPGIALGNVIGSTIANFLLVLGISALIATIHASRLDLTRSFVTMLAASVLFMVLCVLGPISWWHGLIVLAGLGMMLWDSFANSPAEATLEGADLDMPWWQVFAYLGVGLVGLPVGADFLVEGSVNIAQVPGVSEAVIGLTLVAVGTSLPELATSMMAALRGQAEVAMGNVIGSNIVNPLGIIGLARLMGDLAMPTLMLTRDLPVMLGGSLLLTPFVLMRRDITRAAGVGFVGLYAGYATVLVLA